MGNVINISSDAVDAYVANQNSKKSSNNSAFSLKNYLDTRVPEGEESRTTTIRILPISSTVGNPFSEPVHFHTVRVPKEVSASGWKSYLCLGRKNTAVNHEKFGTKCPFCEINKTAYDEMVNATDPLIKKNWKDTSLANASKEARICRCIERGKEDEGVKYLKINLRSDGSDLYKQIMNLYESRKTAAAAKGRVENIFDIFEGRDLIVTFHAGTAPATVVYDADITPLSEDESLIEKWVNDEKKWTDVFTPKSYEYLSLIAEFREPYFLKNEDGNGGQWVDRAEYEKEKKAESDSANAEIDKAEKAFVSAPVAEPVAPQPAATDSMFEEGVVPEGDDLPF